MGDKAKNIISNILGLVMTTAAVVAYLFSKIEMLQFGVIMIVGLSLFLFKASKTREWLGKILDKKIK